MENTIITATETLSMAEFAPLEQKKAELLAVVAESKDLKVEDVNDKTQVEAVRKARINLKNIRVELTKKGKAMRDGANAFAKKVIEIEKELVGVLTPEEERLQAEETRVEQEREKQRRLALLPEKLEKLKSVLVKYFEGAFDFGNDAPAYESRILAMTEEEFEQFLIKTENEVERADLERRQEEERQRAEEERQKRLAEEQRVAAERKALEEERAKFEEEKRIREAEEKAKAEAEERAQREVEDVKQRAYDEKKRDRENRFFISFSGEDYPQDLMEMSDEAFNKLIADRVEENSRIEAERQAKEEAERKRISEAKFEAEQRFKTWLEKNQYKNDGSFLVQKDEKQARIYKLVDTFDL